MKDDLGAEYTAGPPRRVVSLVPSMTESVAIVAPGLLVGATDYCVEPAGLEVPRVGGSKYPRLDAVKACRPDLVLANAEENRKSDVEELRAAGIPVWVGFPATVPQALRSAAAMYAALGVAEPNWIAHAERAWAAPPVTRRRAVVPIWRKPWMVLGAGTFAGDVLRRLGVDNVFADADEPYPKTTVAQVRERDIDLVVLPDEPYPFNATDGPGFFTGVDCALVSGRHLTWHGPSLAEAADVLAGQLAAARRYEP